MISNKILFAIAIVIIYFASKSAPEYYGDIIAFGALLVLYCFFLLFAYLNGRTVFNRSSFMLSIPVITGVLISTMQLFGILEPRTISVYIVFAAISIVSLGLINQRH